jgi:hypothetical protein
MSDEQIYIGDLDKAEVLRVLYNHAKPLGYGFLHFTHEPMSIDEARELLPQEYFDYVHGRVMKVRLSLDAEYFDAWVYDRDNGMGAAQRAVDTLRQTSQE